MKNKIQNRLKDLFAIVGGAGILLANASSASAWMQHNSPMVVFHPVAAVQGVRVVNRIPCLFMRPCPLGFNSCCPNPRPCPPCHCWWWVRFCGPCPE